MNNDQKYFNCSEEHELDYVAEQYADTAAVKKWIKEKCADKTIHYSTHDRVYALLKDAGFAKR